mmetsp:Transcript_156/g.401  ORF Transcript_156/g.401 Transcript_156/m.401 type:complete len:724 (-) Transcript_156:318-2489(-)
MQHRRERNSGRGRARFSACMSSRLLRARARRGIPVQPARHSWRAESFPPRSLRLQVGHEGGLRVGRRGLGAAEVVARAERERRLDEGGARRAGRGRRGEGRLELLGRLGRGHARVADGLGDGAEVVRLGALRGGGALAAHRVVHRVVEEHVLQVGEAERGGDGLGAQVHERGAVAVEAPDGALRLRRGHALRDGERVAHRAHGEEVLLVAVAELLPDLVELPRGVARRRDDRVAGADLREHDLDGGLARRLRRAAHDGRDRLGAREGLGRREQAHRARAALGDHERLLEDLARRLVVRRQRVGGHLHRGEHRHRLAALHLVLRLVGDVGRAAPADQEEHRAGVHLGVRRGEQRVDRVAEARVLHVHERHLARGHVVAQRHAHRGALVGGDDVAHARARTVELGAEGGDAAVGHACEEVDAQGSHVRQEGLGLHLGLGERRRRGLGRRRRLRGRLRLGGRVGRARPLGVGLVLLLLLLAALHAEHRAARGVLVDHRDHVLDRHHRAVHLLGARVLQDRLGHREHGGVRGAQHVVGVDDDRDARCGELALVDDVVRGRDDDDGLGVRPERVPVQLAELEDLVGRLLARVDHDRIRTGLRVGRRSLERLLHSHAGNECLDARDHHEVRRAAGLAPGLDLLAERRDVLEDLRTLGAEERVLLQPRLVLDDARADAHLFERADGELEDLRLTPRVRVVDHWDRGHRQRVRNNLAARRRVHQLDVRLAL